MSPVRFCHISRSFAVVSFQTFIYIQSVFVKLYGTLVSCSNSIFSFQIFGKMLDFYHGQTQKKQKKKANDLNKMISSYPYVGLLNVAVSYLCPVSYNRSTSR